MSVIIEFTSASEPRTHSSVSVAIVVAACAFFFIPTTLIILGYYSSQPTGTLISPLPIGVLTEITPTPIPAKVPSTQELPSAPIIAAPNESSQSANSSIAPASSSNIIDNVATIPAGISEQIIQNQNIKSTSQIYLSPRAEDKSIYSVKTKADGQFTITADSSSDTIRYVDYHIVNP